MWNEAKSIITLGVNYAPSEDPLAALARRERGVISVYAQGADYHDVLKRRLKRLASWIAETYGGDVKIFVDTAPVMEKPLAASAGIGWQGKHTNLVSREFGSWLFLGSIFTTLELDPDEPERDHCGTCTQCLDICPTHAFPAPYQIDARRCISYLTIEHKGPIAREFREAIGNRIYGCDDCLAVCPWNKFAQDAHEIAFHPRIELVAPLLRELSQLDDANFREIFRRSADQAHRTRPLPAQCAHRHRKFRRRRARIRGGGAAFRCLAFGARHGRVGVVQSFCRLRNSRASQRAMRTPKPTRRLRRSGGIPRSHLKRCPMPNALLALFEGSLSQLGGG